LARRALQFLVAAALLLVTAAAWGQPRFSISVGGTEVTDHRTGLVWQRCSAGQSYTGGVCTGAAAALTHEQAQVHARSQPGWRLPNVKELSSLVDEMGSSPSIDPSFPQTPSVAFWTSSPRAGAPGVAWYVDFGDGGAFYYSRNLAVRLRLVR